MSILYLLFDQNITSSSQKSYADRCTIGLKTAINSVFSSTIINLTSVMFETDKKEMNETYLDSFSLIVVGGISYWWNFASVNQRESLLKTTTPILSSASLGFSSLPNLSVLTGVYSNKSDQETWETAVLPSSLTDIIYLNFLNSSFRYSETSSNLYILDIVVVNNSKVLAYASRDNSNYPYIIFNGTKNYHINSYTYSNIVSQIKTDLLLILPNVLGISSDYFLSDVESVDQQKLFFNTFLLLSNVLFLFYFVFPFVTLHKSNKLYVRINLNALKKFLACGALLLLVLFFLVHLFEVYSNNITSTLFSSTYLFFVVCLFFCLASLVFINE